MILEIIVAIFVAFLAFCIVYARWEYGTLETKGIPVIKPYFIMGSDPLSHKKVTQHEDLRRMHKYGHVYGVS